MILQRLRPKLINKSFALCLNQKHTSALKLNPFTKWFNKIYRMYDTPEVKPPYSHCVQIGDPILRLRAQEVLKSSIKSDEIQGIIKQMKDILRDYDLVGIAAPQIGVSHRIIVIEFREELKKKYPPDVYENRQMETLPITTFINPVISVKNFNQLKFPEGCASVCGYTGDVGRYAEVLLSGLNENGEPNEIRLSGWNARIAQHEVDHLNGQIYVDIMEKKSFACVTWNDVNKNAGQLSIPFYPTKNILRKN